MRRIHRPVAMACRADVLAVRGLLLCASNIWGGGMPGFVKGVPIVRLNVVSARYDTGLQRHQVEYAPAMGDRQ